MDDDLDVLKQRINENAERVKALIDTLQAQNVSLHWTLRAALVVILALALLVLSGCHPRPIVPSPTPSPTGLVVLAQAATVEWVFAYSVSEVCNWRPVVDDWVCYWPGTELVPLTAVVTYGDAIVMRDQRED